MKRLKSAVICVFFFSAHEHSNIGIIGMLIWTWIIKKHLRNVLGSYGSNTKQLSACIEKRFSKSKRRILILFNCLCGKPVILTFRVLPFWRIWRTALVLWMGIIWTWATTAAMFSFLRVSLVFLYYLLSFPLKLASFPFLLVLMLFSLTLSLIIVGHFSSDDISLTWVTWDSFPNILIQNKLI